jgi:hypothetical protein
MDRLTSLFRDDDKSGNERKHYSWLKTYFPESAYIIYPNVALQLIIDSNCPAVNKELSPDVEPLPVLDTHWCTQNFFDNSSVDLCVIKKSDHLPLVAFEIDGASHRDALQKKRDEFKDLLFNRAALPFVRLLVNENQLDSEKQRQLARAVRGISRRYETEFTEERNAPGTRSILSGTDIAKYFDLLNSMFCADECLVFPNVALQSIFHDEHISRLTEYSERNYCRTRLVDFCIVGAEDLRPKVAFSVGQDELKQRIFAAFGLPLLPLRPAITKDTMHEHSE